MEAPAVSEHDLSQILAHLLLFFGIAGVAVPLLQRIKVSAVLAYLVCGIAFGPHGLAMFSQSMPWLHMVTITDTHSVHMLGELGIITLMFMIGLEMSFDRLKELRRLIFGLGTLQIAITGFIIFLIASQFENSTGAAVVIGLAFALSSTAIVMKLLEERHLTNRPIGIICFSMLLMQDLAVIPVLVLTATLGKGGGAEQLITSLTYAFIFGALTISLIIFTGRKIIKPLLRSISFSRSAEWLASFCVFFVVGCALTTQTAGLSLALGAFLAGLLIAETEFKHEVEIIIAPLKGLLLGVFFLSVGMMINLEEIMRQPALLALSVVGIFTIKAATLFPLCMAFRIPARKSAEAALYMSQPGEFALLVLGVAAASNLVPPEHIQFFLLVTAVSMMAAPVTFRATPFFAKLAGRIFEKSAPIQDQDVPHIDQRLVLIAGFGRIGSLLARTLEDQKIPYIAFDTNAERVMRLKKKGYRVIYGDARKIELWKRLHSDNVAAAVIAIDDYEKAQEILMALHAIWPLLPIVMRAKDTVDMNVLYEMGAKFVVAEPLESSLTVARYLMESMGESAEEAKKIAGRIRDQFTMREEPA